MIRYNDLGMYGHVGMIDEARRLNEVVERLVRQARRVGAGNRWNGADELAAIAAVIRDRLLSPDLFVPAWWPVVAWRDRQ